MTDTQTPLPLGRTTLRAVLGAVVMAFALTSTPAPAGEQAAYAIGVDGLACPFCAYGIEKELGRLEGVKAVSTDIASGTVIVTMEEGATLEKSVAAKAVEAAGFTPRSFEEASPGEEASE